MNATNIATEKWKLIAAPGGTMTRHEIVSRLRNPHGFTYDQLRTVSLEAADLIEQQLRDYVALREFAQSKGVDTAAYFGGTPAADTSGLPG